MNVGDIVRVLEPFEDAFPSEYAIASMVSPGEIYLEGVESAFDEMYLVKMAGQYGT
jgi:hypothetical protein